MLYKSYEKNVYTERNTPAISLHKLDTLVNRMKNEEFHLTKVDRKRKGNKSLNKTISNNMDENNDILDINSWSDDELQSSMICIFVFCIVALISFLLLIFICYKHEQLCKILSFYLSPSNIAEAATDMPSACSGTNIYIYLLTALCMMLLLYVILKLILRWYKHFCRYHTILHFSRICGQDIRPLTDIAIEFSNLSEIVNIHIAQIKIPITLLSVHDAEAYDYHITLGNRIYDFLKISKPIFLIHQDCNRPICTATTFDLGLFQMVKLQRILKGQYLTRIVSFQNDT